MASYLDIRSDLFNDSDLKNRVDVATMIAANNLLSGTPTEDQSKWAAAVLSNPRAESTKAFRAILAENNTLTVAEIKSAPDSAVQTTVDAVVLKLIVAFNAV